MRISDEHALIERQLLETSSSYIDYDGRRIDLPLPEKEFCRMQMLEELMHLSKPISDTDWVLDMRFSTCPCTLALQKWQESMG